MIWLEQFKSKPEQSVVARVAYVTYKHWKHGNIGTTCTLFLFCCFENAVLLAILLFTCLVAHLDYLIL